MSERRSRSLEEFAKQIEGAEHPERELLRMTIDRARQESPELADALRYCAIPRRFDTSVIGALRGAPNEAPANSRILAGVLAAGFAVPRRDGGYVYHDSVREAALGDWRTSENREQFKILNDRLVSFYAAQQGEADELETALGRVASIVQSASPARYAQIAGNLETRILAPLLEALYHRTLISPQGGQDLFETYFQRWESRGRIGVCNALVNGFRDFLERLYPEPARHGAMRWARYYDGRRLANAGDFKSAESKFRELLPEAGDDVKLKLWVLADLGSCLHMQSNFIEARKYFEEAVDLDQQTGVDPWNLPNWLDRIAGIDTSLNDLPKAEQSKLRAIQAARNAGNDSMVASSLLDLSAILAAGHRFVDAVEPAMQALHIARTKLRQDVSVQRAVLRRFAYLAARQSPALLETLKAEVEAHFPAGETSYDLIGHRNTWVELLQQSGQITRAMAALQELYEQEQVGRAPDAITATDVTFRKAILRSETGFTAEAVELYTEILARWERGGATLWHRAAALHNRAGLHSDLAHWAEADADIELARSIWEQMGHRVLSAQTRVAKAVILRKQGKMKDAEALLDAAGPIIEAAQASYLPEYYRERAHVRRGQARWQEAQTLLLRAAEMDAPSSEWTRAVRHYADLASIAMIQGHWAAAEKWSAQARQLSQELAEHDSFQYSDVQRQSDDENARAMHLFCTGAADDRTGATTARELLVSASRRLPDHFWYLLNLAYACAEIQEWKEAANALNSVRGLAPQWWCPALDERVNDFRSQEFASKGDSLLVAGSAKKAMEQYQRAISLSPSSGSVNPSTMGVLESRLAMAMVLAGDPDAAYAQFTKAYEVFVRRGRPDPGLEVAKKWRPVFRGLKQYRLMDEVLKNFETRSSSEAIPAQASPAQSKGQNLASAVISSRRELLRQAEQQFGTGALRKPSAPTLSSERAEGDARLRGSIAQGRETEKA